jgi:hypothetical protein
LSFFFIPKSGSSPQQPFLIPKAVEESALLIDLDLLRGRRPVVQIIVSMPQLHRRALPPGCGERTRA